ncbi:VWA domain-containing protein [Caenimonas sedimenti]|uniref:VWA domain-containing protein n=1 Tax=Caenimonas sedimenti TaxID=2596921 RepID=A0A562ZKL9_9BURK|nr:VWA domain-containing protein [Caenimonas sedimenti]TWO69130.1 VWA domain-containing protein [Caenimonas sedimenti]
MSHEAQITRGNPTAFLFVVDQSGSMSDRMSIGKSKSEFVADALNRTLMNLVGRATRSDGVRDYFEIGVIGYGGRGVDNGFSGALGSRVMNPISAIEQNPTRVEDRKKKMDDGAGGVIETSVKFPVWFEPRADGGTPMRAALAKAAEELAAWCDAHPESYPPTVLHVTDGESGDGDPEEIASGLAQLSTKDGSVVVMNIHVSALASDTIKFPGSESGLPDNHAKLLFRMSSALPPQMATFAKDKGYNVSPESRGYMFNAEAGEIVDFFDIGTRASQLR